MTTYGQNAERARSGPGQNAQTETAWVTRLRKPAPVKVALALRATSRAERDLLFGGGVLERNAEARASHHSRFLQSAKSCFSSISIDREDGGGVEVDYVLILIVTDCC